MKNRIRLRAMVVGAVVAVCATEAAAQISHRPYDFPGADGPGLSVAARQAVILNEIVPSFSPEFLLRAPTGGLLTVVPISNGGDVPLVFGPDGFPIPFYRRGLHGDGTLGFGAGLFNSFFVGDYDGYGGYGAFPFVNSISVWTGRLIGASGFDPAGDAITEWTAAAYFLGGAR